MKTSAGTTVVGDVEVSSGGSLAIVVDDVEMVVEVVAVRAADGRSRKGKWQPVG